MKYAYSFVTDNQNCVYCSCRVHIQENRAWEKVSLLVSFVIKTCSIQTSSLDFHVKFLLCESKMFWVHHLPMNVERYSYLDVWEKGRDLTQSYDKSPYTTEMSKGHNDNTNNATKKFDYRAVADRLRTNSWSNYGHPTGVINPVYGPNLPIPRNSRVIKKTHDTQF